MVAFYFYITIFIHKSKWKKWCFTLEEILRLRFTTLRMTHILDKIWRKIAQVFIKLYQWTLSPDKSPFFRHWLGGRVCRHHPHCSQYGYECFDQYNFFTACFRTMDRISRCTPWLSRSYDPVRYRVVFASGSPIWVPFLQALVADPKYDVVWILTMPDMPSGRGMKMNPNIIKVESEKLQAKKVSWDLQLEAWSQYAIYTPNSLRLDSKKYADEAKETYERLKALDIDILYVVAYGNLLPQHILDIPKIAPINIHGSLLPAYRGASPLQTVFLDGLKETGITLMRMEAGLDSGPMIDKQMFKLGFTDTVADLIDRVKEHTPKWSLDSIDRYIHGELEEEIQDETLVTHCGKIEKEDGLIQLSVKSWQFTVEGDSLETIYRTYKAYYLWPKTYFQLPVKSGQFKVVTIDELVIDETLFEQYKEQWLFVDDKNPPTPTPGVLASPRLHKEVFSLNPAIVSLKVKPEWGKSILWEVFVRGNL